MTGPGRRGRDARTGSDADVVVVGAGPAGCSAARSFWERGADVLVVEAGPAWDTAPASIRTVDHLAADDTPGWTWASGVGDIAEESSSLQTYARQIYAHRTYVRGRGVGGGTAVNGMLTELPTPHEISPLEGLCGTGFAASLADTLALVAPRQVADAERSCVDRAVAEAVARLGWPVGPVSLACDASGRQRRAAEEIFLLDTAVRVLTDGDVVGLDLDALALRLRGGQTVRAPMIVLAAGAFGSPALLATAGLDLGRPALDHPHLVLALSVPSDRDSPFVIGVRVEADGAWVLPMARTGPAGRPGAHGVLLVIATDASDVEAAARRLREECRHLVTEPEPGPDEAPAPASVFHGVGTLPVGSVLGAHGAVPGLPGLHVMDAAALPMLPSCGPWLTVAAAARLWASHAHLAS